MDSLVDVEILELALLGFVDVIFIVLFLSAIRSTVGGAPFLPMLAKNVGPLLDMVPLTSSDTLIDIGCGDGRVMDAALRRGVGVAIGYDVAWLPLYLARRRLRKWGGRATLIQQDARAANFSSASVVYLYLMSKLVDQLAGRLSEQLRVGARVLCADFPIDVDVHRSFRLIETKKVGASIGYLYEKTGEGLASLFPQKAE